MGIQDWSAADISKARSYFLDGLAIKDIAKKLGRTTTATNKALSRYGIRFEKPRRNYTDPPLIQQKAHYSFITPYFDRKTLRKELENWVSFWHLCEFLSDHNICIYEQSMAKLDLEHRLFRVDSQILNARQLLLMANKIRAENNMKPFLVKGLSW